MDNDIALRDRIGLSRFLREYPEMRILPSSSRELRLGGAFNFCADSERGPVIEDSYKLNITVPERFPQVLPIIKETEGRIPRTTDNHVFQKGALCLGSPLRLREVALSKPELTAYVRSTLVPYLYAFSHWEETGERFLFGELAHDAEGLLADYALILNLEDPEAILDALQLLGMKRRKANKKPCPCGCGNRLGVCRFNETIRELRTKHGRPTFRRLRRQVIEHTS